VNGLQMFCFRTTLARKRRTSSVARQARRCVPWTERLQEDSDLVGRPPIRGKFRVGHAEAWPALCRALGAI
jgi:hypothetical protein